jgi:hypothetical protein
MRAAKIGGKWLDSKRWPAIRKATRAASEKFANTAKIHNFRNP